MFTMDVKQQHNNNKFIMLLLLSYIRDRICSIFSGAGNFCLPYGLRQLTGDTKNDVSCLQTLLKCRNEDLQVTFCVGPYTTFIVNIRFKTLIFQRIGKKNNQSLAYNADREIPTFRSTDNARTSVNLVSGINPLPSGWDFSAFTGWLVGWFWV